MKPIRNSAKAVIVQDGRLLVIRLEDQYGTAYVFPGGGQEKGEELKDAVARECLEEIGQAVNVGELLHIREYIGKNHEFAEWDADIHQVEFYFACSLIDPEATVLKAPIQMTTKSPWNGLHLKTCPTFVYIQKQLANCFLNQALLQSILRSELN